MCHVCTSAPTHAGAPCARVGMNTSAHVCASAQPMCTGDVGQTQATYVPHSKPKVPHVFKMLTFPCCAHPAQSEGLQERPQRHSKGQRPSVLGTVQTLTQVLQLDMAQDVESTLLEVVDKVNEARAAPWVLHHQQHLWAPELDMVLPHIQHQQVLPHLEGGRAASEEHPFFQQPPMGMPALRTCCLGWSCHGATILGPPALHPTP